mmetsp:Transcript_77078/g.202228  ORF Transcript_77078/g.202228 Transcript_77078/m.202228 type:complete len:223 (-) Transcript_77078:52-720(-)
MDPYLRPVAGHDGARRSLLESCAGLDELQGRSAAAGSYGTRAVVLVYLLAGSALMATYVWGVLALNAKYGHYGAMKLWGRLYTEPDNRWLLHVYYGSILAATVGFFPSLGYALKVAPRLTRAKVNQLCGCFLGFYLTELLWMPLCVAYVESPSPATYAAMRLQLGASGLFALGWAYVKIFALPEEAVAASGPVLRALGVGGTAIFALHCAVLDAVVWPPYFK